MAKLTATFLYSGFPDYWRGDSDRWDDDKGCLFSYYDHRTTLKDLIDGWVDDFCAGGDCDSMDEDITDSDVRAALLDMLTDEGRRDYDSGAVAECAKEFGECNDYSKDDDLEDCDEYPFAVVLLAAE